VVTVSEATVSAGGDVRVTRSRRNVWWTGIGALVVVAVFAYLPYLVYSGTTGILVQGFIILTLASMWNLLAGYAGLVSVGQQPFRVRFAGAVGVHLLGGPRGVSAGAGRGVLPAAQPGGPGADGDPR